MCHVPCAPKCKKTHKLPNIFAINHPPGMHIDEPYSIMLSESFSNNPIHNYYSLPHGRLVFAISKGIQPHMIQNTYGSSNLTFHSLKNPNLNCIVLPSKTIQVVLRVTQNQILVIDCWIAIISTFINRNQKRKKLWRRERPPEIKTSSLADEAWDFDLDARFLPIFPHKPYLSRIWNPYMRFPRMYTRIEKPEGRERDRSGWIWQGEKKSILFLV